MGSPGDPMWDPGIPGSWPAIFYNSFPVFVYWLDDAPTAVTIPGFFGTRAL